ncbi:MAG: hypothetical protein AAGJ18_20975, partial [Bacteroidota bacterium]
SYALYGLCLLYGSKKVALYDFTWCALYEGDSFRESLSLFQTKEKDSLKDSPSLPSKIKKNQKSYI